MNGLQKFYTGLWAVYGAVTLGLLLTGSMTMLALTVLGFVAFGLIFMGMMCVLPTIVGHPVALVEESRPEPVGEQAAARPTSGWLMPGRAHTL